MLTHYISVHSPPPDLCIGVHVCMSECVCLILPAKRFNSLGMALKGRGAVD